MKKALLIGSNGTIGSALSQQMQQQWDLHNLSQQTTDYSEASLDTVSQELRQSGSFSLIINCIGTLHNARLAPEKRLSQLNEASLREYFYINAILPSLCLRFFTPLLDKQDKSVFISLSAMVGSIKDNQLGGWYGYRSSKAALNMMVRTAAIEVKRTNKNACLLAVHPGTTQGALSRPFTSGIDKSKYYTPEKTAQRMLAIADTATPEQSGEFLHWDGRQLDW